MGHSPGFPASGGAVAVSRAAARAGAAHEVLELLVELRRWFFGLPVELVGIFVQVVVLRLVRERVLYVDLLPARPDGLEVVVAEVMLEEEARSPRGVLVVKDGDKAAPVHEVRR